jgi:hypothetical protein
MDFLCIASADASHIIRKKSKKDLYPNVLILLQRVLYIYCKTHIYRKNHENYRTKSAIYHV